MSFLINMLYDSGWESCGAPSDWEYALFYKDKAGTQRVRLYDNGKIELSKNYDYEYQEVTEEQLTAYLKRFAQMVQPPDPSEERLLDWAIICRKWGLKLGKDGWYYDTLQNPSFGFNPRTGFWVKPSRGQNPHIDGEVNTAQDLEKIFSQELPFDREWREAIAKEAGLEIIDGYNWGRHGKAPIMRTHCDWPSDVRYQSLGYPRGSNCGPVELPDRPSWLKFIRENF
jgi:hypothetical protein